MSDALREAMSREPVYIKLKTEGGWDVWLYEMIYNWRICLSPKDDGMNVEAAWCYFGRGSDVMAKAVAAATEWHDLDDGAPEGYDKCVFDARAEWMMRQGA